MLALALAGVCVALQWVWTVEVLDAGSYAGDVRAYLTEAGVRPFVWKSSVDTAALRGALEWRYPKVAWVEVGWRGTALCVRLVEGTPKGNTVDWHGSRDVVASRDGVIVSVVPVAGTATMQAGGCGAQGTGIDCRGGAGRCGDGCGLCPLGGQSWPVYGTARRCGYLCGKSRRSIPGKSCCGRRCGVRGSIYGA